MTTYIIKSNIQPLNTNRQKESFALIKFATKFAKTPGYLKRVLIKYLLIHVDKN